MIGSNRYWGILLKIDLAFKFEAAVELRKEFTLYQQSAAITINPPNMGSFKYYVILWGGRGGYIKYWFLLIMGEGGVMKSLIFAAGHPGGGGGLEGIYDVIIEWSRGNFPFQTFVVAFVLLLLSLCVVRNLSFFLIFLSKNPFVNISRRFCWKPWLGWYFWHVFV